MNEYSASNIIRSKTQREGLPRMPCGHEFDFSTEKGCENCAREGVVYSSYANEFSIKRLEELEEDFLRVRFYNVEGNYPKTINELTSFDKNKIVKSVEDFITNSLKRINLRQVYIKVLNN